MELGEAGRGEKTQKPGEGAAARRALSSRVGW